MNVFNVYLVCQTLSPLACPVWSVLKPIYIPLIDHPLFHKDFSLSAPQLAVTFARSEVGHPLAHVVAGAPQLPDVSLQLLHLNLLKEKLN